MTKLTVIICGSRNFVRRKEMWATLDIFREKFGEIEKIIDGGAKGADFLAHVYAIENKIATQTINAEWKKYGQEAGFKRNQKMADMKPDACIAFFADPQKRSRGTSDMIKRAKEAGIKVYVPTISK